MKSLSYYNFRAACFAVVCVAIVVGMERCQSNKHEMMRFAIQTCLDQSKGWEFDRFGRVYCEEKR